MTPNFLDVITNLDSKELEYDSWVQQFKLASKRVRFYGDDTWLRLFPATFDRSEGTTSFFVADTVEVDQNVTRHVRQELESGDWDVLILHYLGLDHVGHQGGPNQYEFFISSSPSSNTSLLFYFFRGQVLRWDPNRRRWTTSLS